MAPSAPARFQRSTNACDACRGRKSKCSGKKPCSGCINRGVRCEFTFQGKKGYSKAYVDSLLGKINNLEEKLGQSDSIREHSRQENDSSDGESIRGSTPLEKEESPVSPMRPAPARTSPGVELASGPAFESRVRSMMQDQTIARYPGDPTPISSTGQWRHLETLGHANLPPLQPKDEALGLFNVFADWMGTHQHFLDLRSFVDGMDRFYESDSARMSQMQTMWFLQYLLVMALGMVIRHPVQDINSPPGYVHFSEAMRRLPPRHELGLHGIISVEILALAGVYMQWCDQKHDAYLYIGSALRLALAFGCAQPFDEQKGVTSEKHHRTRIWWSIYVHDKRLAATLGLPSGADERHIHADLPKPAPGFEDPLPIIVNSQIAHAVGEIMDSLYSNTTVTQKELVRRIQTTLTTLYKTERSIIAPYHISFSSSRLSVTRTSATLYLMLFQAILLCIRPMLFQWVKNKIQALKASHSLPSRSQAIAKLCRSCKDTALKTIRILSALRQDKRTSYFGYFEFDAAFAAAFILVMDGFLESENLKNPPMGLSEAAENLQHMSRAGSKVAQKRLDELRQFCSHIWSPEDMSEEWEWLRPRTAPEPSPLTAACGVGHIPGAISTTGSADTPSTTAGMNPLPSWQHSPVEYMDWENFQADLNLDVGDIYSCYNDPTLPLTGDLDADFAEVNKMFFNQVDNP